MEEPLEFTGETVDAAIAAGLEQLGVKPGDVLVEVLEEPSRGVFGIGARPARVRLKLMRPPVSEPEREPSPESVAPSASAEAPTSAEDAPRVVADVSPEDADNAGAIARSVLLELLDKMNIRGQVTVEDATDDDQPVTLNIEGADAHMLIGRRGDTLNSLQYITRLIVSKRLGRRANIIIDADGYKSSRVDRLEQLAQRMADQAIETGRVVALEPMPANERRIIHMTLRGRDDVETRSSGEGDGRKVTIVPL
ncbi:MAG: protein jag [Anaerolineaceae bacterium]|nr:MAG: protein jag [Anaerolineaceae bacterium]